MKKAGLFLIALLLGTMVGMAQNWQNSSPEDLAKRQTEQIKEKCGIDKAQEKKVYDASLKASQEMSKLRGQMRDGGDRDAMREKMTKIREEQNKEMKKILSEAQYKKYEEYLEERRAEMRERRNNR